MSFPVRNLKILLSLLLAVTVTTLCSLRVYAADEPKAPAKGAPAGEALAVQDCTGTLMVKSGKVKVNWNEAKTGATVTAGSIVSTNDDGNAILEFGAIGRIELEHHTTIVITCVGGGVQGRAICNCDSKEIKDHQDRTPCSGHIRVESRTGQIDVKVPKIETIQAGHDERYDGPVDFTAPGGSSIKIECGQRKAGLLLGPGLLGLLALIGVGAAVATGIAIGDGDTPTLRRPPVSGS